MMWRGAWLSIAWVTGRALQFGDEMHLVERFLREQLNVTAQYAVLVAIVWWWWSHGHELPTVKSLMRPPWRRPAASPIEGDESVPPVVVESSG